MLRVAIITDVVPHYRLGFYQSLLKDQQIRVTLFCQAQVPGANLIAIHRELNCEVIELPFVSLKNARAAWQFLPVKKLLTNFDVYVFSGNPRFVSNVIWATFLRFSGKAIIIQGQAHTAGSTTAMEYIRLRWWRLFNYFFVYTDQEADQLRKKGFDKKVVVGMNNGLDQEKIDIAKSHWPQSKLCVWKKERKLDERVLLLSCARLVKKNHFDLMIEALVSIVAKIPNLLWCIIGNGDEEKNLKSLMDERGLTNNVLWIGSLYEEEHLAPWFLCSQYLVHPGAIGLTLMHAYGYGLPVITHNNPHDHMPEFAAFEEGKTGHTFAQGNYESLSQVLVTVLHFPEQERQTLGENGLNKVRTKFNTSVMANTLVNLCKKAVTQSKNDR